MSTVEDLSVKRKDRRVPIVEKSRIVPCSIEQGLIYQFKMCGERRYPNETLEILLKFCFFRLRCEQDCAERPDRILPDFDENL
jgi:hypothetical protein